ncbi:GNAT family N-acetyltransferase [Haliea sp. AH-315-K21]|uniref:N-acetyltransferase domain-containing protein n=1 Tax=SAR86 cluster bacterium TaxID=2030880 RepID=A0A2A5C9L6_9GAMM|nr:GNAT family N-acetyltransferase [Haliea sp. AH-315-K21]PCJ40171.1 MAG: hypothetical protein COA71_11725 [SAR86 cluster bacterium]
MDELLKIYDRDVRANPIYPDIIPVVRNKHTVKLEGPLTFISYWDIPEDRMSQIVHEEVNDYKKNNTHLMWRVFEHDTPPNLESALEYEGLKKFDSVTLMTLAIDDSKFEKTDLDIRELKESSELHDFLAVVETAFGEPDPFGFEYHDKLLAVPNFKYYVGYSDNTPVAAARFEIPIKSRFGLLFGGCVIPSYRGKGFYKALISARYTDAKKMGLKYISTEARETSRPILEKLGFRPLAKGRTWELTSNTSI